MNSCVCCVLVFFSCFLKGSGSNIKPVPISAPSHQILVSRSHSPRKGHFSGKRWNARFIISPPMLNFSHISDPRSRQVSVFLLPFLVSLRSHGFFLGRNRSSLPDDKGILFRAKCHFINVEGTIE